MAKEAASQTLADVFAQQQREISVSEFFSKNRHLLGFDSPKKALLSAVKEAVDNSLDACEEARQLPEIWITIDPVDNREDRFVMSVTDNGPGIVSEQVPKVFGKLLYGSKFHRLKMSRGQQGIGISAAGMYGLLTTGKSVKIVSRTHPEKPAHYYEIQIDTTKNEPILLKNEEIVWAQSSAGTQVVIELIGSYQRGRQSVDEYLYQTAMANPHASIHYRAPDKKQIHYLRAAETLPEEPREIKPHPHGIELGVLIRMLKDTGSCTLCGFLRGEFSRVSSRTAKEICERAGLYVNARPKRIAQKEVETLFNAINSTKLMRPPLDCLAPIGARAIEKSLARLEPDFVTAVTRPPAVYRGNPFQVEAGIAYGLPDAEPEAPVRLLRFANRVPLLYQQGACAITQAVIDTSWRSYGLSQSKGSLPYGPAVVMVHIASVWVPFTSESKEAVAHYPEIINEVKRGLQECGRKQAIHLSRRKRTSEIVRKRSYIEMYLPHVVIGLKDILGFGEREAKTLTKNLKHILDAQGLLTKEAAELMEQASRIEAEKREIIVDEAAEAANQKESA